MTNKTKQAEETRRMAEALRSMQAKIDAYQESKEGDIDEDFRTEFLGEEMDVLIYVLINRLGFVDYEHEGDDPIYAIVYDYIVGEIDYEAVLCEVDKSHKLLTSIMSG